MTLPSRYIDWQCIGIEKLSETDNDVLYCFIANIWEPNFGTKGRSRIAGQSKGIFRIIKVNGKITLIEAMPGDTGNKRFYIAARKIAIHWESNEYPDKTMFACG